MKKIIRLNENDLARIVRRVIKEDEMSGPGRPKEKSDYDMSDLIGKTVEFTLVKMDVEKNGDEYFLDSSDMSEYGRDKFFRNAFNIKLQGVIVEAYGYSLDSDNHVKIVVKQNKNGHPLLIRQEPYSWFYWSCKDKTFRGTYAYLSKTKMKKFEEVNKDILNFYVNGKMEKSWFSGTDDIRFEYRCPKLEEHLQNRPPCGGFDFSMNKNGMDNYDSLS